MSGEKHFHCFMIKITIDFSEQVSKKNPLVLKVLCIFRAVSYSRLNVIHMRLPEY